MTNTSATDIVPAQIIGLGTNSITLRTENNEIVKVKQPATAKKDKVFMQTMKDILKSGLWIPVNKKLNHLLHYDWFDAPIESYSF
ncbi:hypothetical protein [Ligilactobacillus agilis]|uniref:hypothetical protein n=1 Tax=Ligilactobacillus agilis TaxID=1601 RepID=UPI00255D130B|nr:hypothetical protein [Ligilactobacillus agilis]